MLAELRKAAPLVPRVVVSAEAIQHSLAVARRESAAAIAEFRAALAGHVHTYKP